MPEPINMQQGGQQTQGGAQATAQVQDPATQTGQATAQSQSRDAVLDHANNPALSEQERAYWAEVEAQYVIPRLVREKYHQLIPLIKETESMNDDEREYWFQILPIMTEDQIKKFVGILENEKTQLAKLDQEYDSELAKLNDKHMVEWQSFEAKQKREELKEKEAAAHAQENAVEENLLDQLSDL